MKNKNVIITKKWSVVFMSAVLSAGMLMGCGKKAAEEVKEEPKQETEAVEEVKEEPVEEVAEAVEEESSVSTPFLEDLEKYDSIISTLTKDQYYAFAAVGDGYDVLLVADGAFDNGDGNMAAIDATVYGLDNGKPYYAGNVWSDGTAYPIAVYEDMLMCGGNHSMTMANVIDASVIIQKEAYEEFDENGNATYFLNEGDIDNIKELEDDSVLAEMFKTYSQATVINFFQGEAEPSEKSEDENPGFFETDSWSISYDTDSWYGYVNDEGNTIINYTGECAGTSLIEISELDVATAKEAVAILSEKKGKELTVSDGFEGVDYTCFAYAADEVYESGLYIADFYTLYEHNGKVIVLDEAITHDDDDARAEALGEVFAGVKNALVLK